MNEILSVEMVNIPRGSIYRTTEQVMVGSDGSQRPYDQPVYIAEVEGRRLQYSGAAGWRNVDHILGFLSMVNDPGKYVLAPVDVDWKKSEAKGRPVVYSRVGLWIDEGKAKPATQQV